MKRRRTMMVVFSAIVFLGAALLWAQDARDQIEDAPDLPRVLLIGDSIRRGYMHEVRELLEGKANVHWPPVNCGGTWESLSKTKGKGHIDEWLGDGDWDVIHFNWGLWDINRWIDGKRNMQAAIVATEEEYAERLEELVERMEKTGATLIWASTTYVQGGWGRHAGDEYRYNEVAEEIMDKHGILINDLHALSASFPLYGEADAEQGEKEMWRSEGNVHFSEAGSQKLAEQVAYAIKMVLEQHPSIFVRSL